MHSSSSVLSSLLFSSRHLCPPLLPSYKSPLLSYFPPFPSSPLLFYFYFFFYILLIDRSIDHYSLRKLVEERLMGRQPCCAKVGLKKGPWSPDEDQKLLHFLLNNPLCCWRLVPKLAGLMRCGKSCRLRWLNYLRPDLKRGSLSESEEKLVIDLHAQLGNRWSKIAAELPGRTDNEIKNLWNTHIKKKLIKSGIDPRTHKPISPSETENSSIDCHGEEEEEEEEEEEKTPMVSIFSDSDKSFATSSVSSSACSSHSVPVVKDEAIEVPTIDWDEPMWLLEMDDIKGFDFFSSDLDSNICF